MVETLIGRSELKRNRRAFGIHFKIDKTRADSAWKFRGIPPGIVKMGRGGGIVDTNCKGPGVKHFGRLGHKNDMAGIVPRHDVRESPCKDVTSPCILQSVNPPPAAVGFQSRRSEKYIIFERPRSGLMWLLGNHCVVFGRNTFRTKATKPLQSQS